MRSAWQAQGAWRNKACWHMHVTHLGAEGRARRPGAQRRMRRDLRGGVHGRPRRPRRRGGQRPLRIQPPTVILIPTLARALARRGRRRQQQRRRRGAAPELVHRKPGVLRRGGQSGLVSVCTPAACAAHPARRRAHFAQMDQRCEPASASQGCLGRKEYAAHGIALEIVNKPCHRQSSLAPAMGPQASLL